VFFSVLMVFRADPSAAQEEGLQLETAVRITLVEQPSVKIQGQVLESAFGDLQIARGQFDTTLQASFGRLRDETPQTLAEESVTGISSVVSHRTNYRLDVQKLFRNGLRFTPSLEFHRADNSVSPIVTNQGRVSFSVTQPLLRGRGRDATAAQERFSEIDVDATTLDLRHATAQAALYTVVSYWRYLAADRRLRIFEDSEVRSRDLVEQTQALIDADNRPASDIKQMLANLSDRLAARIGADQILLQSRQELGLVMGLRFEEIALLGPPSDDFPDIPGRGQAVPDYEMLSKEALERRADLEALRRRESQAQVLVRAAENGVKPQFDLVFNAGYAGIDEGTAFSRFFSPFQHRVPGLNASLNLLYQWPAGNNAARGQLVRSHASRQQTYIQTSDLERTIRSNVLVARDNLLHSAERLRSSREAAELYRSAIEDERTKQQLGLATVIDLIVTEDRLTASLLEEVDAMLSYASAVAQLRFETGTLLAPGEPESAVVYQNLTTVPFQPGQAREEK
jgi:outer membrane protein TolC